MQTTINYLTQHWELIIGYGGFAAFAASLLQTFKHKLGIDELCVNLLKMYKLDGAKLMYLLAALAAALPQISETALDAFGVNTSWSINYPVLFLVITAVHRFAISPLYGQLQNKLNDEKQTKADAQAYRDLVAAQKQIALPTTPAEPVTVTEALPYNPVSDLIDR